jgi:hypothetical protein
MHVILRVKYYITEKNSTTVVRRSVIIEDELVQKPETQEGLDYFEQSFGENGILENIVKRDTDNKTTVKMAHGAIVIPETAGVQSISIPPLLTLNNNMSNIPVPIPNTSVVHYAKVNTVIRKP